MISSPPPPPVFVQHPARASWGRCLVVAERDGKIHLQAEDGEEHAIAITHRAQLVPVNPPAEEIPELLAKIQGKRSAAAARLAKEKKAAKAKVPKPPTRTFEQQVERWKGEHPAGFSGGAETAIARAKQLLSAEALAGAQAFDGVQAVVTESGLLHPMEGQIPLRAIPEAHRPAIVAALREALHGAGDYGPRYEALVAAFSAARPEGSQKGPSWPLTSIFAALYHPREHVFIKPKLFQEQAKILGLPIEYSSTPNGAVYEQFRQVLRTLDGKLREQGVQPRDLMDVGTFVAATLAPEKAAAAAPAPPATTPPVTT
jgi:hypothetical protein